MRPTSTLLLALLLVTPLATSAWSVKGALEPDTALDITSGYMALDPELSGNVVRVYFNGFMAQGGALTSSLHPNVAPLGTSVLTQPALPVALLGIWTDCNQDGVVGLGDQGALEYASPLLLDTSVCPPRTPDPSLPWRTHNDGRWVVEFIPLGYDDITTAEDEDPLTVNDTTARVWADWGLPGAGPGLSCPTTPAPVGTFHSTGGMIRYADCFAGFELTRVVSSVAAAAGAPGLGFDDAPRDRPDQSASPLNIANPWGDEADAPMARAFDCSGSQSVVLADPTGGALAPISDSEGTILTLTVNDAAPSADAGGSPAGTVNETEAGATDCDRSNPGEIVDTDGHQDGSDGDLPYLLEGPSAAISPFAKRTRPDHVLAFEEGVRGSDPLALVAGPRAREHAGASLATVSGLWIGTGAGAVGRNAFVSRSQVGPEPVTHITYYAHVSTALIPLYGLRLPFGVGTGTYGVEGCSAGTFDCDPGRWWLDVEGNDITPRDSRLGRDAADPTFPSADPITRIGARMGDRYNMRDTDCIDSSFDAARDAGVHWGILTGTSCV